ncbi:MAG TPA: hypothetical protein EYN66_24075 [Myxococcales bacterium]|nr:hypothetical protein [Myxococcales bacterium]
MSHNAAGIAPHVLSFTPATFIAAGVEDIVITTARGSVSCQLEIPAALGTVISGPTLSNASSGQIDLTYSCNILAPPGTPTAQVCTLSNGGHVNTGAAISILHQDWTPATFIGGGGGGFWDAESFGGTDLASVSSWPVTAGTHQPMLSTVSAEQPLYRVSAINGKPGVVFDQRAGGYKRFVADSSDWNVGGGDWTLAVLGQKPQPASAVVGDIYYATDAGTIRHYTENHKHVMWWQPYTGSSYVYWPAAGDVGVRQVVWEQDTAAGALNLYQGVTLLSSRAGSYSGGGSNFIGTNQLRPIAPATVADFIVSQVLFIPRLLTTQEKIDLAAYWTTRYGV